MCWKATMQNTHLKSIVSSVDIYNIVKKGEIFFVHLIQVFTTDVNTAEIGWVFNTAVSQLHFHMQICRDRSMYKKPRDEHRGVKTELIFE